MRKTYCIMIMLMFSGVVIANAISGIDMEVIKQIESSGNPYAYNSRSNARGLYQITPICLKEYNNYHLVKYTSEDLYDAEINYEIANWYLNTRIPQMLKHFKKPVNVENILISYNAGISYVVQNKEIPTETINYLKKYKKRGGY